MNSDCTALVLSSSQELRHNLVRWRCSVNEEQIEMLDALLDKLVLFVLRLVEADDQRHAHAFEYGHVVVRCERTVSVRNVEGSRERDEFAWDNPVQVTVFDFLEVLILLDIESAVVVPAERDCEFKTLEAVQVGATVSTVSHSCVTIGDELVVVWPESLPGLVCGLFQHNDHEGTHQESSIALFRIVK